MSKDFEQNVANLLDSLARNHITDTEVKAEGVKKIAELLKGEDFAEELRGAIGKAKKDMDAENKRYEEDVNSTHSKKSPYEKRLEHQMNLDEIRDELNIDVTTASVNKVKKTTSERSNKEIAEQEKLLKEAKESGSNREVERCERELNSAIERSERLENFANKMGDEQINYAKKVAEENKNFHNMIKNPPEGMNSFDDIKKLHESNMKGLKEEHDNNVRNIWGEHLSKLENQDVFKNEQNKTNKPKEFTNETFKSIENRSQGKVSLGSLQSVKNQKGTIVNIENKEPGTIDQILHAAGSAAKEGVGKAVDATAREAKKHTIDHMNDAPQR